MLATLRIFLIMGLNHVGDRWCNLRKDYKAASFFWPGHSQALLLTCAVEREDYPCVPDKGLAPVEQQPPIRVCFEMPLVWIVYTHQVNWIGRELTRLFVDVSSRIAANARLVCASQQWYS